MTKEEAFKAMQSGEKITHDYFDPREYYYMEEDRIIAEDGVDHTEVFNRDDEWRNKGWKLF